MDKYLFFKLFEKLPWKIYFDARRAPQDLWAQIYQTNPAATAVVWYFGELSLDHLQTVPSFGYSPTDPTRNIDLAEFM